CSACTQAAKVYPHEFRATLGTCRGWHIAASRRMLYLWDVQTPVVQGELRAPMARVKTFSTWESSFFAQVNPGILASSTHPYSLKSFQHWPRNERRSRSFRHVTQIFSADPSCRLCAEISSPENFGCTIIAGNAEKLLRQKPQLTRVLALNQWLGELQSKQLRAVDVGAAYDLGKQNLTARRFAPAVWNGHARNLEFQARPNFKIVTNGNQRAAAADVAGHGEFKKFVSPAIGPANEDRNGKRQPLPSAPLGRGALRCSRSRCHSVFLGHMHSHLRPNHGNVR